jgi:Ca2+-binding RTX toxin-like protein
VGIGDIRIFDYLVDDQLIFDRAFTALDDPAQDDQLWQYWTVDADGENIQTQPTQFWNHPQSLSVVTGSGATPGVEWQSTPNAPDAGNYLNGGGGNDTLIGGDFADELFDAFGDNTLQGGGGNDVLTVMSGTNTLEGGQGADLLIGGVGSDTLRGGSGADVIVADTTSFLVGNDTIDGGAGDDLLKGGDGSDLFIFRTTEGDNIIADLSVNSANLAGTQTTGIDFQVGFDKIQLLGFGYTADAQVLAKINNEGDFAVFRDQDTSVTFYGLQANQLSIDDFIFV